MGGDQGEAVGGRDEAVRADDHVAVAVAVGRRSEVERRLAAHLRHQLRRVDEVGVGVVAAEVGQRHRVDHRALGRAEAVFEDRLGIGAGDRVHRVEAHLEAARAQQRADRVEVEQAFHQLGIVGHRVDHLDRHAAERLRPEGGEVAIGGFDDAELVDAAAVGVDRLGDALGRGAAVADVVLDAEVAVRPAGVVAGGEDEAAVGLVLADQVGDRRGREQAVLPHQEFADAVGAGHLQDHLDRLGIEEPAVAADHQGLARDVGQGLEHRLHEVFEVVGLLEHRHRLAQSRGSGFLVVERRGRDDRRNTARMHRRSLHGRHIGAKFFLVRIGDC